MHLGKKKENAPLNMKENKATKPKEKRKQQEVKKGHERVR